MKTIQQLYLEKRGTLWNAGIGAMTGSSVEGPAETASGRTIAGGLGGVLAGRLAGPGLLGHAGALVGGVAGASLVEQLRQAANRYLARMKQDEKKQGRTV